VHRVPTGGLMSRGPVVLGCTVSRDRPAPRTRCPRLEGFQEGGVPPEATEQVVHADCCPVRNVMTGFPSSTLTRSTRPRTSVRALPTADRAGADRSSPSRARRTLAPAPRGPPHPHLMRGVSIRGTPAHVPCAGERVDATLTTEGGRLRPPAGGSPDDSDTCRRTCAALGDDWRKSRDSSM